MSLKNDSIENAIRAETGPMKHLRAGPNARQHANAVWAGDGKSAVEAYVSGNASFRGKLQRLLRKCHRKGQAPELGEATLSYDKETRAVRLAVADAALEGVASALAFERLMTGIEQRVDARLAELHALADVARERPEWTLKDAE